MVMGYKVILLHNYKINNTIQGVSVINTNMENNDLEKMGFDLSGIDRSNSCEGLHMYMNKETIGEEYFQLANEFPNYMFRNLAKRGYKNMYGSCLKNLESMYYLIGFDSIDSMLLNGQKEILLRYNLKQDA